MKKIRVLVLLLMVVLLAGCGIRKPNIFGKKEVPEGRYYNIVTLQDKGINMFQSILPEGWNASISSQYRVDSSYPFLEEVTIKNSDNSAQVIILSQHSYVENTKFNEGINQDYYTTYMHQMNASEYSDYMMETVYKTTNVTKKVDVDKDVYKQLNALHDLRIELGKRDAETLQTQNYGITLNVAGVDTSVSRKQYKGTNYYELFTCVSSVSTSLSNSLDPLLNSFAVQWYMPYVIVYEATSEEAFDEYYDDYNFIIANSNFTKDYYAMNEYVSSAIVNAVTTIYTEKSKIGLQAVNDYIDSNYSSTSSASTNDKVMQMWDDVINEVDVYKTEDGSLLRTSIFNDTVAQNGNEIYVGPKAGIPYGFNELSKAY